jgi:Flp pilus assembly pilin Flp
MAMQVNSAKRTLSDESGQGTTEYAILVGVLVVIAIVAILAFRDKVSELWSAISDGINQL